MPPTPRASADRPVRAAVVVLGAGSGSRVGSIHNKVFLPLAGRRVISWCFHAMAQVACIERFVMVIREEDREVAERTVDREINDIRVEIITGGASRHESELAALRHLTTEIESGAIDIVLIHDGARPLISPALIRRLVDVAVENGGVFPGLEADDSIRYLHDDGTIDPTPPPTLIRAQTPQVFQARPLLAAYRQAAVDGFVGTDTAACFQHYHPGTLHYAPGESRNLKITYPDDLFAAEEILRHAQFRIT